MLANGQGKSRASRDASLRKPPHWRLLFLSTGEISLANKMAEDSRNRRQTAGQQVRVIDLPSDGGAHGSFDNLHGFESAARLADHLKSASSRFYEMPIRRFLEMIFPDLLSLSAAAKESIQRFVDDACSHDGCDGQVKRVAGRFGLMAYAGELAISLGILPLPEGESLWAARTCSDAWVEERGGSGAAEERDGIAAVRDFLTAHHSSRFQSPWEPPDPNFPRIINLEKTINLAGYRKRVGEDGWDYFITPGAWGEIAAGLNKKALAETLIRRGFLIPTSERDRTASPRIPGIGTRRVYHVSHTIFSEKADG